MKRAHGLGLTLGFVTTMTTIASPHPVPLRSAVGEATLAPDDPELRAAVAGTSSSTPTRPTGRLEATPPRAPLLAAGAQPTPLAIALRERATVPRVPTPRREPPKPLLDDDPVPSPDGEIPPPSAWTGDGLTTLDRQTLPASTATPSRRFDGTRAARALDEALRDRDAQSQLGTDFPGATTIASALASAVRPHTPPESTGTYVAHVGSDGRVSHIAAVAFDVGQRDGWQAAANDAAKALADHTFPLRHHYRSGAVVTVRLESDLQLPARWWSKTEREPLPEPVQKTEWRWPYDMSGEENRPPPNHRPIELPLPPDMDNLGRYAGFLGVSVVFDVSEIATHVQRIIYVRSVKVRALPRPRATSPVPPTSRRARVSPRRRRDLRCEHGSPLLIHAQTPTTSRSLRARARPG